MSQNLFHRSLRAACAVVLLTAGPVAAATVCGADLAVTVADPAPVHDGGFTFLHPVVRNTGGIATTEPFTLAVHLPPGVVGTGTAPGGTCSTGPHGHTVTCTFPAGLDSGATAGAEVRISVASGMDPEVLRGTVEVALPGDPTPADNSATFDIEVL
ncbi:hypothetical protein [Streptomyces sp. BE303]|uniref:hypothetical protein n=1 Tax=Streptomyces sp. BE303 TaxID=3002528 RepID=UPI002E77D76B|nr:hypothetical protein [Streptomyces sp. BE303]MED7947732.1 hypothetical protein [Streptomyces sp. BE303]